MYPVYIYAVRITFPLSVSLPSEECQSMVASSFAAAATAGALLLLAAGRAAASVEMTFRPDWAAAAAAAAKRAVQDNSTHYEDPKPNGCRSDEEAIQIQGVQGDFCTPECQGTTCPTDVPYGVTASPQCALQDASGKKYCALLCSPSGAVGDSQCGENASCKSIDGVGICTYDD